MACAKHRDPHRPCARLCCDDTFYIARRVKDRAAAFACIDRVLAAMEILAIDDALLRIARAAPGSDFEDNVQIACAQAADLDLIITRDPTDFTHVALPAIEPAAIVKYLPQP